MIFEKVFLKKDTLAFIQNEVQKTKNNVETGGVLMGYYTVEDEVVITHCSGPGPNAIQKRHSILFDSLYCQEFVDTIYKGTNGQITYLGDWHSHTTESLTPSKTDRIEMKKITKNKKSRLPFPLMIITYQDKGLTLINAYGYLKNKIYIIDHFYRII
ncbi:Mov34/MPN/PAD-1 family protein [Bacillus sp. DJP31]|uniref:Mov34/MPN/PAD-1 family protein n=1 Tax=Bacillus sp. DJP31 TaxID=3409789 RepID=UPI003BB7CF0E